MGTWSLREEVKGRSCPQRVASGLLPAVFSFCGEESYVVTARFAQHLNVACVIAVPLVYDRDFMTFAFMMFANSLLYSLHWLVSAGRSHVSVARLRCFYAVTGLWSTIL